MADDPICTTCGEKKSAHVKTDKGPYTHPREARGEGTYVLVRGGYTYAGYAPGVYGVVQPIWEFRATGAVIDDGGGAWGKEAG
jgi:hypothetical protein